MELVRGKDEKMEKSLWNINGDEKILHVFEDHVEIEVKKTGRSLFTNNWTDGIKTIFYVDVIGIQYKKPTGVIRGYYQLETASMQMNNDSSNFLGENSFPFTTESNELKEAMEYINKKISEYKQGVMRFFTKTSDDAMDSLIDELPSL